MGSVTRVLASDLERISSFLRQNFSYDTGPYQGYDFEVPARRYLAKMVDSLPVVAHSGQGVVISEIVRSDADA